MQLDAAQTKGEDQAIVASRGTPFPVYFPTKVGPGGTYQGPGRPYRLRTLDGSKRRAYVMVVQLPGVGEYYDVEGMNWTNPPMLAEARRAARTVNAQRTRSTSTAAGCGWSRCGPATRSTGCRTR